MIMTLCFASLNANYTTPPLLQFSNHYVQAWQSLWFVVVQMGTTEGLFTTLQVSSLTTQSKLYSQVLSQAGVLSKSLSHHQPILSLLIYDRCMALPTDIDGPCGRWTWAFTDELLDTLDSKTLWDKYGIDDDILVCKSLFINFCSDSELAFYSWLSMSRHLWDPNAGFASSNYKRNLQGSPCHLGWRVSCSWAWTTTSGQNSGWYRQVVCPLLNFIAY